jgi:hypothetical protein
MQDGCNPGVASAAPAPGQIAHGDGVDGDTGQKHCYPRPVRAPSDPACPSTAEQVLVNGANAVCGVPAAHDARDHRTATALALSASLAVAFAYALLHRQGLSPKRIAILLLAATAIAAPGLRAVWMDRADAPMHATETSKRVVALVDEMDTFASARNECLQEVRNNCVECQPLVRFVLPVRTTCAHPRGRIDLRPNALETGCVVEGDTLECGSSL